jgi:hypothetical protein
VAAIDVNVPGAKDRVLCDLHIWPNSFQFYYGELSWCGSWRDSHIVFSLGKEYMGIMTPNGGTPTEVGYKGLGRNLAATPVLSHDGRTVAYYSLFQRGRDLHPAVGRPKRQAAKHSWFAAINLYDIATGKSRRLGDH